MGVLCAQEIGQQRFALKIDEESARRHLSLLTSDEFAGRGTGAIGARKTADYLQSEFRRIGLQGPVGGSYFQPVHLVETRFEIGEFRIGNTSLQQGEGFYLQGAGPMAQYDAEEVVFLGAGIHEGKLRGRKSADLRDKVVLVIGERGLVDARHLQAIVNRNPTLVLVVSDESFARVGRFGRRGGRSRMMLKGDYTAVENEHNSQTAVAYLTVDAADRVLAQVNQTVTTLRASLEGPRRSQISTLPLTVRATFGMTARHFADDNVLGYLPGSEETDEIIVIMAHYDHEGVRSDGAILRGADDNGSGTVGLLELARAFSQAKADGHGPKRGLLFIGLCAEEKGLLGSKYYTENPIFPLENTVAALNMDMIGRIDDLHLGGNRDYIHVLGADKLSSELHEIVWSVNERYTQLELDTTYNRPEDPQRLYYRSDHYNFARKGIPSVFFFSGLHPHYHTPEDTIEKIDFEMLVKRAQLVFHTAWELANRKNRIVVDSDKP